MRQIMPLIQHKLVCMEYRCTEGIEMIYQTEKRYWHKLENKLQEKRAIHLIRVALDIYIQR
jgi:hypothetical protein